MNFILLVSLVLIASFTVIFGVAYVLDKRGRKKVSKSNLPAVGPVAQTIFWIGIGCLLVALLSTIAIFFYRDLNYAKISGGLMGLYIILGIVYKIIRPKGI